MMKMLHLKYCCKEETQGQQTCARVGMLAHKYVVTYMRYDMLSFQVIYEQYFAYIVDSWTWKSNIRTKLAKLDNIYLPDFYLRTYYLHTIYIMYKYSHSKKE